MTEALKKSYDVCEEIGRGRFGVVFRCVFFISGESFAVKSIDKRKISTGDSLDSQCLFNEPKILTLVSPHPNIIHLHNLYKDDSHLHMVLDLCSPSQDLYNLIIHNGRFSEAQTPPMWPNSFKPLPTFTSSASSTAISSRRIFCSIQKIPLS
ncbi:hypothetical protein CRYUN_Cryun36dG0073600 [Craigia yunnanensis]